MNNEISQITQQLFNRDSLASVSVNELKDFVAKHPYFPPARFLLAKKEYDAYPSGLHDDIITAGLYFSNPLWFEWQLRQDAASQTEVLTEEQTPAAEQGAVEQPELRQAAPANDTAVPAADSPMVFQSYHTIDYFASQGIRLQQAELSKDKLGQQLKSFTEWLRSMKKLPVAEETSHTPEDDKRQQIVIKSAENSIVEKEIVTEAMAEVWAKQGNRIKAIETYNKLSLLNPAKSAYFAAKIDQLK